MPITAGLPRRRRALILGWLCILALLPMGEMTSTDAAMPKPKAPLWGISTGLYGKTTLPGSHFTYGLTPGTAVKDTVILHNFAAHVVRLSVYPADLRHVPGNGLVPAQAYEPRRGAGAWIHLKPVVIAIPPHRQIRLPFTVSVPHGVAPGDYYGAVVAATEDGSRKPGVHIATRAALMVHFSVPGRVRLEVTFGKLRAQEKGGRESFNLTVTNTGNVTFVVGGAVQLRDGSGQLKNTLTMDTPGLYVVPGGTAPLTTAWRGVPLIARIQARAVVQITVNGKVSRIYSSEMIGLTFFPWKPAVVSIIALTGSLVIGWRYRRRLARRFREWREDRRLFAEIRAQRKAAR